MRTFTWIAVLLAALLIGTMVVAARQSSTAARPAAAAPGRSASGTRYVLTGSIKELMHGIIDPSADALWDSVSYDVTAAGVVETVPRSDDDWYAVRRHALLLAEAANLLRLPGRRVAPARPIPGMEDEPPGPEDLTPAQIQVRIDADPARFARLAQGLTDAAVLAITAVDARSVDGLSEAGDKLDRACEACHLEYWYPKGQAPAVPTSIRKKK
jgi:hypothetical protein